jgi:hypothetical protein
MLEFTRRYAPPVWGVYLDADEVLIDGQWVPDLIYAAEQQTQDAGNSTAAIPLAISEIDASVGRVHRIIRLDLLERHVLSMSQWKFFSSEIIAVFPVVPVWRPGDPIAADDIDGYRGPIISGTPHIHHRAYYRPPVRSEFRLHQAEMEEAGEIERAALDKLGIISDAPGQIPINQDQGLIVATDTGKISVPSMLDELRKGDRQ